MINCPVNDTTGICNILNSSGAGLGVFIQYMAIALPTLLIILAMVGIIVAIGYGISSVIREWTFLSQFEWGSIEGE